MTCLDRASGYADELRRRHMEMYGRWEPTDLDFKTAARALVMYEAWRDWEYYWARIEVAKRHREIMKLKTGF